MTNEERIKADAEKYIDQIHCHVGDMEYEAYIAGATAENEKTQQAIDTAIHKERNALQAKVTQIDMDWLKRAQVLVEALTIARVEISSLIEPALWNQEISAEQRSLIKTRNTIDEALEQWKSGKGKEVPDKCTCKYPTFNAMTDRCLTCNKLYNPQQSQVR